VVGCCEHGDEPSGCGTLDLDICEGFIFVKMLKQK
jgi:hypothetical protein